METVGISIVIAALCLFLAVWTTKLFNRLIKLKALNDEGWNGVLTVLKRRRDLIPNILRVAEVYVMTNESETLRNITQARVHEQAARSVAETAKAEAGMRTALAGFRTIMENYPDLKADRNMMKIQEELSGLSGLEERIEKTRHYYNATARDYNMEMDQFPANFIVGLMGFKRAAYFEADEQSQK